MQNGPEPCLALGRAGLPRAGERLQIPLDAHAAFPLFPGTPPNRLPALPDRPVRLAPLRFPIYLKGPRAIVHAQTPRIQVGIQVAVVIVALLTTGGLLAFGGHPASLTSSATISGTNWTEHWSSNQSVPQPPLPRFNVTCTNRSAPNGTSIQLSCIVATLGEFESGSQNGTRGPYPVRSVTVSSPFVVIGYWSVFSYPCPVCSALGVKIELPETTGSYGLIGVVYLAG